MVTFPMAESAYFSMVAAVMLAIRSVKLVPKATKVIAATSDSNPMRQPKMFAKSATMAVIKPIHNRETKKQSHPPQIVGGGMSAKML